MSRAKRVKTKYIGVYYIQGRSVIDGKPERIYYIRYKINGKETEEKAGRQFQDGMTAIRAAKLRRKKIEGTRPLSTEKLKSKKKPGETTSVKQSSKRTQDKRRHVAKTYHKINSNQAFHPPDASGPAREAAWEQRLRFETLISELSAQFINLPTDSINEEIEKSLKQTCETLGLQRSVVYELSSDKALLTATHFWAAPGISTLHSLLLTNEHAYFNRKIFNGEMVSFSDPDELPEEEVSIKVKEQIKNEGARSLVGFPFKIGTHIIGAIAWMSHSKKIHWSGVLVDRLRLISEVLANALSRKRTDEAIHKQLIEIKELRDRLQAENYYLLDEIMLEHTHHKIIGQSNAMKKVLAQMEQVAPSPSTVLILGESGTGKELFAHEIHKLSSRKNRHMVKVNCAALSPTLIESELFGHERGAYSGAVSRRLGRFEIANGSTIFLDEIGELPMELQSKLLRVVQEGQFERLGSSDTQTVDVRLIVATNRDLERAVKEGKFRLDLYYRLNVFPIKVPPLRDHVEDIPLLVKAFVQEFSASMGKTVRTIPIRGIEGLQGYDWPGNVRELRNLVERAMIVSRGKTLHLAPPETKALSTLKILTLDDLQRRHILVTLNETKGRIYGNKGAAKLLGLNADTLRSRMRKLGISREQVFCDI